MAIMVSTAQAQAFQAKNFNMDLGYAIGSHRNAFYSPGVLFSLEKGVHKWIGVGAYAGYQYNINGGVGLGRGIGLHGLGWAGRNWGRSYNAHSIPLGATGSFHFYQMIGDLTGKDIKQDKLDIAIKHSFGVRLDILSGDRYEMAMDGVNPFQPRFDWGTSAVVRYFFTNNVGIYAEVGYPAMGNLIIGAAFKF